MEKCPSKIDDEATYLKWKWRTNLANSKTGLDNDALRAGVVKIVNESGWKSGKEDWYDVATRCFDFLVDNVAIGFSKYDCFPAISAWDRHRRPMSAVLWSHAADVDDKYSPGLRDSIAKIRNEGRAMIRKDFDHSAPDWVDILKLGFPGMKARVDSYAQDTPFDRAEKRTAAAMMRFLDRLIATAKAHPDADFKREYFRILHENTDWVAEVVRENERHLAEINPALILSLALESALEKGVDAFSLGYKYNFTTLSECGFATAVDSLLAVKEFVYDRKVVSLAELGKILAANWEGHEELRLRMKRSKLKWGCGNAEADALAKEVIEDYSSRFVGKPNGRGGVFVCYGLNSRGFDWGGRITGATPDGRKKGEHLSKNMAPSVGAETEGITGSIKSYGAIAPENFPCGSIFDVMIHPSTVKGEKGLKVFRMLVERFFAGGGVAMNVNIVSPETLRDAQAHPEKYENLQVRVAGWNIRWNDIPRKEQDEYIARIETVGGSL